MSTPLCWSGPGSRRHAFVRLHVILAIVSSAETRLGVIGLQTGKWQNEALPWIPRNCSLLALVEASKTEWSVIMRGLTSIKRIIKYFSFSRIYHTRMLSVPIFHTKWEGLADSKNVRDILTIPDNIIFDATKNYSFFTNRWSSSVTPLFDPDDNISDAERLSTFYPSIS